MDSLDRQRNPQNATTTKNKMIKVKKFVMKVQKTLEESLVFNLPSEFQLAKTKFPDVTEKIILFIL